MPAAAATLSLTSFYRPITDFITKYPFSSQVAISTVKATTADLLVQFYIEKKNATTWNKNRTLAFATYGFAFQGVTQWLVCVKGMRKLFDPKIMDKFCEMPFSEKLKYRTGLKQLGAQLTVDMTMFQPLMCWPSFYLFKEFIMPDQKDYKEIESGKSVTAYQKCRFAMSKYGDNFWEDNFGMTGFWAPALTVIYSVPVQYRMPILHSVSFVWCNLLSFYRGGDGAH
eukprot:jgi/Bigna1/132239/aug1.17_g6947